MEFVITFLEGFISFISPCMLPLLPLYISYFAGGADKKHKVFLRALCFVLGFTAVFSLLGCFRHARRVSQGIQDGCQHCRRAADRCVRPFLSRVHKASVLQGNAERTHCGYRCIGVSVRGDLFGQPDTLRRCVSRFGAGACRSIRYGGQGGAASRDLFAGAGLAVCSVGTADRKTEHRRVINIVCGSFLVLVGILMACGPLDRAVAIIA